MEFILRCAAAIGGKWNKVRTKNGKKRKQACDEAVTLSDMAFAACVVNTYGGQWTRTNSKRTSDSGKDSDMKSTTSSDANKEASCDKAEIT